MSFIKTAIISSLLLLSGNALAQSAYLQALQKSLKPWQPLEIAKNDHELTVVLPGKSVPPEAYEAVIMGGVCPTIWNKSVSKSAIKDVKKLNVTNQYKMIGYSFEDPISTCDEIGQLMDQPAKVKMMSKTSLFSGVGK